MLVCTEKYEHYIEHWVEIVYFSSEGKQIIARISWNVSKFGSIFRMTTNINVETQPWKDQFETPRVLLDSLKHICHRWSEERKNRPISDWKAIQIVPHQNQQAFNSRLGLAIQDSLGDHNRLTSKWGLNRVYKCLTVKHWNPFRGINHYLIFIRQESQSVDANNGIESFKKFNWSINCVSGQWFTAFLKQ